MGTISHGNSTNQQRQFLSGGWWRFSSYEIREGAITPAKDAVLQWYDPWQLYRITEWDSETPPPYQSLLELMLTIGAVFDEEARMWRLDKGSEHESQFSFQDDALSSNEQDAILGWCSRFGLLGILPHCALSMQLPIRFSPRVGKGLLVDRKYVRVSGKWIRSFSAILTQPVAEDAELSEELIVVVSSREEPADLTKWPYLGPDDEFYRIPGAAFLSRAEPFFSPTFDANVSMADVLQQFFPDIEHSDDQSECPLPLTSAFWSSYSERLGDFVASAMAFLEAVESVLSHRSTAEPFGLEWFLEPIGVSLRLGPDRDVKEQWVCPSLLSVFARMALYDASADRRIRRCDCCGQLFVTSRPASRYCSQQCGWRHRKRRSRHPQIGQG